jgi:D-sedoheptulose 7-phosphate isomerase
MGMYESMMNAYKEELIAEIEAISAADFEQCVDLLLETYRQDKQVFVMGNGGSAATANHFACDFGKNAVHGDKRRFRIISVCDNVEAITALGNDIGFEDIFRQQLINLLNPGDLLIAVSASGNSPDLVRACEYAKGRGAKIMALSGFGCGKICAFADASLIFFF